MKRAGVLSILFVAVLLAVVVIAEAQQSAKIQSVRPQNPTNGCNVSKKGGLLG